MRRLAALVAAGVLVLPLLCLQLFAPGYVFHLGFPLDDSWIHAVYGRSLARAGMLAYNPGIPANGETSPLWAVFVALPHLVAGTAPTAVIGIKVVGLLLHAATALLVFALALRLGASRLWSLVAVSLVALHPDLIAAAASGMEVPLATCLALWVALELVRGPSWRLAMACLLAPLGRPEVACVGVLVLAAFALAGVRDRLLRTAAWTLVGSGGAFAVMAWRNLAITGRPLPATFYAKVGTSGLSWTPQAQAMGFRDLLSHVALVDSLYLLVPLSALALWLMLGPRLERVVDTDVHGTAVAGALYLTGLAFFAVSFALIPPIDGAAFYHQRYPLPGLPLVLLAIPLLLDAFLRRLPIARLLPYVRAGLAAALALALLAPVPARLRHLANDARNIDDVQVAEGRALADTSSSTIVWAVDAGAIRYFGNAFVVDMIGLNSPDILSPAAPAFLRLHAPAYLSLVTGWTTVNTDRPVRLDGVAFRPSTSYTVTSSPWMAVHYLTHCPGALQGARYAVFRRQYELTCADR